MLRCSALEAVAGVARGGDARGDDEHCSEFANDILPAERRIAVKDQRNVWSLRVVSKKTTLGQVGSTIAASIIKTPVWLLSGLLCFEL